MARMRFEWDSERDRENQKKRGVPFEVARYAFADPDRVIAEDVTHSQDEQRYFCFGRVEGGIPTVRFIIRGARFESLAPGTGGKAGRSMKSRIKYTEGPIGEVKVVRDFLPPPEELAFQEEQVKVTIGLSKGSVEFFKREARKHNTQYQKMIRRLLDLYVAQHEEPSPTKR